MMMYESTQLRSRQHPVSAQWPGSWSAFAPRRPALRSGVRQTWPSTWVDAY